MKRNVGRPQSKRCKAEGGTRKEYELGRKRACEGKEGGEDWGGCRLQSSPGMHHVEPTTEPCAEQMPRSSAPHSPGPAWCCGLRLQFEASTWTRMMLLLGEEEEEEEVAVLGRGDAVPCCPQARLR
jgi:hypothetical protein